MTRSMGSSISKEDDDIASSSAPDVWFGKSICIVFVMKFRRSSLRFKKKVHRRQSEEEDGARHSHRKSLNARMGTDEMDKEWQYYW
jgi:hypothetical protein